MDQTIHRESHGHRASVFVSVCVSVRAHRVASPSVAGGQSIGQEILNHSCERWGKSDEVTHLPPRATARAHGAERLAHSDFVKSRSVTRESKKIRIN